MSKSLAVAYQMKKKDRYAKGGEVEHHSPAGGSANRAKAAARNRNEAHQKGVHKSQNIYRPGSSEAGYSSRALHEGDAFKSQAKKEHEKVLSESRSMLSPNLKGLAQGGEVTEKMGSRPDKGWGAIIVKDKEHPEEDQLLADGGEVKPTGTNTTGATKLGQGWTKAGFADGGDVVDRILKQHFSEGGKVANSDHGVDNENLAGFAPNEFDDLALRDDLEFSYTGANSGDELGNEQEDHDRSDIIARIMKSRAKKDRLPNPR